MNMYGWKLCSTTKEKQNYALVKHCYKIKCSSKSHDYKIRSTFCHNYVLTTIILTIYLRIMTFYVIIMIYQSMISFLCGGNVLVLIWNDKILGRTVPLIDASISLCGKHTLTDHVSGVSEMEPAQCPISPGSNHCRPPGPPCGHGTSVPRRPG